MKLKIAKTKLLTAIFARVFSIVSTTDHSINDEVDRLTRNDVALEKSEFRRYADVPEVLHVSRRSAQNDSSDTKVKHRDVIINVTSEKTDMFDFEYPPEYEIILPKFLIWNLRTADRFAENVVSIFGNILETPNSGLTYEQFSSLKLIYNAIKRRQFPMLHLLRLLKDIENKPKVSQFHIVLDELPKVLPPYLSAAANFLISQIDQKLCDTQKLFASVPANLNFLTGISDIDVDYGSRDILGSERNGFDSALTIEESIFGPFFVNTFALKSQHNLTLSQPLFAGILLHLPNHDGCPVFNEYVRFVAELAWKWKIPNWNATGNTPTTGRGITFLIDETISRICQGADVSYDLKQALWYIKNHYANTVKPTVMQSAHEAYQICQDGIHIHLLFSLITPQEFSPHAIRLKDQLIGYIDSNQDIIRKSLVGMNTYGYMSAEHLLLAFLTRLQTQLPAEEIEIRNSVSALLSILMLKRQAWYISWPRKNGVTLWTLLDAINDPQTNQPMAEYAQEILTELLEKPYLWSDISNMKLPNKKECYSTEICLRAELQITVETLPSKSLSSNTHMIINQLKDMINDELEGPSKIPASTSNEPLLCSCPMTLQPETITSTGPTSTMPSLMFTPVEIETTSEEASVNGTTVTMEPHIITTIGTASKEPLISEYALTPYTETLTSTGPLSTVSTVYNYTTPAGPFTPVEIETTSEEASVNGTTVTMEPHIITTIETASTETPVSEYTPEFL